MDFKWDGDEMAKGEMERIGRRWRRWEGKKRDDAFMISVIGVG
jgi:hypothetical protein